MAVSTDLEEWAETWGVSGLIFSATAEAFSSDAYTGEIQYWSDCAGSGTQWVVLAAQAADGSHGVILTVALAPEDEAALDTILESLSVNTPIDG